MKLIVLIACLALVSAAVVARDLSSVAKKERARRQRIHSTVAPSRTFTNEDLESYPPVELDDLAEPPAHERARPRAPTRDLEKDEFYWRKQAFRHQRELARLDAHIRRLEWRLRERQVAAQAKGRRRDDPAVSLIAESLESLREEREALSMEFRERARKAGAFPGWLR